MSFADHPPSLREIDDARLEALIETMFLAAYADGDFGPEERAHFNKSVESLTDRRMSEDTVEKLVARMLADLEQQGRDARLASVRQRLDSVGARRTALGLTIQVVAADGIIRTSERELIMDLADALEIDRDAAADMVRDLGG
ncbi:MAG: tellurite resistance TerB family protein [Byssovorax sp.]